MRERMFDGFQPLALARPMGKGSFQSIAVFVLLETHSR